MKKAFTFALTAALIGTSSIAFAQDSGPSDGTDVEPVEEASNGAVVTREEITEQVLDENGEPVPALNADGEPILDADGNPVFETQVVGFTQTVATPSGITVTVTKVDGSPAVVTHENLGRPDVAAAARDNAGAAASGARQTADAARQSAAAARDNAGAARDNAAAARSSANAAREAANAARDNVRNIPRPGRGG